MDSLEVTAKLDFEADTGITVYKTKEKTALDREKSKCKGKKSHVG